MQSQYKGGTFKIALADRWLVVFSGTQLVQGAVKFPDEKFSFSEAISEVSHLCPHFCSRLKVRPTSSSKSSILSEKASGMIHTT